MLTKCSQHANIDLSTGDRGKAHKWILWKIKKNCWQSQFNVIMYRHRDKKIPVPKKLNTGKAGGMPALSQVKYTISMRDCQVWQSNSLKFLLLRARSTQKQGKPCTLEETLAVDQNRSGMNLDNWIHLQIGKEAKKKFWFGVVRSADPQENSVGVGALKWL